MAPIGGQRSSNANANPSSDRQIAASNSTLNTWVGRRQPSWLTNAKPAKPTPRLPSKQSSIAQTTHIIQTTETTETTETTQIPQATQIARPVVTTTQPASVPVSAPASTPAPPSRSDALPPQRPVQVQTSTSTSTEHTVLPSPAPSDEPSPSVAEPQTLPFTTEARFVLDTNLDDQPGPSTVLTRTSSTSASPRTSSPTNMVLNTPPTPNLPSLNPNVPPREQLEQPPAKRRCVGATYLQFLQSLGASRILQAHLYSIGGEQHLEEFVERPRYQLLAEACDKGDLFFVALHQLFCAWTVKQVDVHQLCDEGSHHPSLVDNAFGIMGTHLKSNSKLRPQHLHWFATFPAPLKTLQVNPVYGAVVKQVLDFLMRVSYKWQMTHHGHSVGGYPLLMSELLNTFSLFSPILQTIMFRASRRSLGIVDGYNAGRMEALFKADQQKHMNADGSFIRFSASKEYHAYNDSLIEAYRNTAMQSRASHGTCQTGRQSVPAVSPVVQQPGLHAPRMDPQTNPQMQLHPDQAARFQSGPVASPSISPVDEARMHFQYSQPLGGTPLNAPSPTPVNSPFLCAPVPPQFALPSQTAPNSFGAAAPLSSTAFAPPGSAQFSRQQVPERRFSQQGVYTAPSSPQPSLIPTAPHLGIGYQPGQYQPQEIPNFNGHPLSRGISYSEGQALSNGSAAPIAGGINAPPTPQPVYSTNNFQGHFQPSNAQMPRNPLLSHERLIPPPGERIGLRDYPHDAQDVRSVYSALHQAHLRSPKRMPRELHRPAERYYQAVKGFPISPVATPPQPCLYKFKFTISEMDYKNITKEEKIKGEILPVNLYSSGSLRVRIRCCYRKKSTASFTQSAWVVTDTQWPEHIFIDLNGTTLSVRRKAHYSKDVPIEASSAVKEGENLLSIFISPGASAPLNQEPYIAVELVEILSHSHVLQMVRAHGKEPEDKTREVIKRRLGSSGENTEDDELAMVNYLSIDLADPFTMSLFNTPVRGENCTHLECFDLETWLNTRLGKKCCFCNSSPGCTNCAKEPSFVDKWKCPLCAGDARPYSLRIDEYLAKIRSQLESENKLRTKSILVSADGTWRPKEEPIDDSDTDTDDDGSGPPVRKTSRSATAAPLRERPPVEVIELDD
ncbi:hypothetical protein F4818DRAFT_405977 [Hypoxylon cercidicola]|nr:hypothetical protein F4818DRAFT_405977 [Hypoxylon cercidicola]